MRIQKRNDLFNKMRANLFGCRILLSLVFITACSDRLNGPIMVKVIHPSESRAHCEYSISPARIETLHNLSEMSGALGSVVSSSENLGTRPEILDKQEGLSPVVTSFSQSGGFYAPVDFDSLFAASLYYAIETGYLLFSRLDSSADMIKVVPNFAGRTRIVHEARRTFGEVGVEEEAKDNAEFFSHTVTINGQPTVLNYFFSFPTESVTEIPLGLNLGIMVHEYSHLVMHYLFFEPGIAKNTKVSSEKPTKNTLASLDEGLADYFGYLASGDPGYFLCSYPEENRDLSVPKYFDDRAIAELASDQDYDSHWGGAIFASINYEIGRQMNNHELNGKYLIKLMSNLLTCPDTQLAGSTNTLNMDFASVASCHARLADSRDQSIIRSVYQKYMGKYGGH